MLCRTCGSETVSAVVRRLLCESKERHKDDVPRQTAVDGIVGTKWLTVVQWWNYHDDRCHHPVRRG